LHFGNRGSLEIREISNELVEATVKFPLIFANVSEDTSLEEEKPLPEDRHDALYQ
jgi:hypothetical protein